MLNFGVNSNRRRFLQDSFCGFGSMAVASLLHQDRVRADIDSPLTPRPPHGRAQATAVIFLFMAGGPSHIDTFDPKPLLNELDGQKRPQEFGEAKYQFVQKDAQLLGSKRKFRPHGESGLEVSDLFPHLARLVDDIAVIRSCYGDMVVHSAAQYELLSGRVVPGFPSMGSWTIYGLGSESDSLPAYENHGRMAAQTDKPVAALLADLKRRGLLESTLVLWGGEFGRSPEAQGGNGRDHHNLGFTMWMAGGGIEGGRVVGATDAIGLRAIEKPYHFRDIHTTILHQLGLDQELLSFPHLGRKERLTQVHGKVIREVL